MHTQFFDLARASTALLFTALATGCGAVGAVSGLPGNAAAPAAGATKQGAETSARADNTGLSERSASEAYNLERGRYRDGCDPNKPLPPTSDVASHCAHSVATEGSAVAAFSPSERALPRIQQIVVNFERLKAYANKIDAEVNGQQASSQDGEQLFMQYLEASRASRDGINALIVFKTHGFVAGKLLPGALAAKARSIKPFADACATKFKYVRVPSTHNHDVQTYGTFMPPAEQCALAIDAEKIITAELPGAYAQLRIGTDELELKESAAARTRIKSGFGVTANRTKCARDPRECQPYERALSEDAAKMSLTIAAPPVPSATIETEFQEAIKASQASYTRPTFHDPAAEAAMRQALSTGKISVLSLAMKFASPAIKKNNVGIPTLKQRTGAFVTKVAGESYCRAYEISAGAPYTGGGTFGPYNGGTASLDGEFVIAGCN